jgi:SPW repeat
VSTMESGPSSRERHDSPTPAKPTLAVVPERNTAYPDTDHFAAAVSARDTRAASATRAGAAIEAVVGLWLAVSPWVVGSGGSQVLRWNDFAVGLGLVLLALPRLAKPALPRTPMVSFGLGAWTIVAAFVLSFQNGSTGTAPLWNAIACGAALTAAAAWSTTEAERAVLRKD